ncbi:MAG: glycerate kinase [Actinobacteria bacterium]|nr:glycerate kinase [Actinomycetota bacterium]
MRSLFHTAVAAATPARLFAGRLPEPPSGRVLVAGAGKAAAAMAAAVEDHWPGPLDRLSGLVVTRYGHGVPTRRIDVVEAAHPVPDAAGRAAAGRIHELAGSLQRDDLLICLISGGGSALLAAPAAGVTLEDKQAVNRALLRSGAPIDRINCVRKHLSAIKGGRLAEAAHPARVVTYLISDVPGDDPSVIASGPTVPDPTTFAEALHALEEYGIEPPASVGKYLFAGSEGRIAETPKPGDPAFADDELVMLATARDALAATAALARRAGITPLVLGDAIEGEARDVGTAHARLALALARSDRPSALAMLRAGLVSFAAPAGDLDPLTQTVPKAPCIVLSGGETTVTVRGDGRGGRNTEYALSLALSLGARPGISAIAADTDGIDGSEDNAGAVVTPDTLARAAAAGLDATALLADNDAYAFFDDLDDLVVTGPTRTNVNDFRAVLIQPATPSGIAASCGTLSSGPGARSGRCRTTPRQEAP